MMKKKQESDSYKRFILGIFCSTLSGLGLVGLINILVDPYDIFLTPQIVRFNRLKPELFTHGRLSKYIYLSHHTPSTIFLGSSRMIEGMDIDQMNLPPFKEAYNGGLHAAHIDEIRLQLEHTIKQDKNHHLKRVILGLDFYMFTTTAALKEHISFWEERKNNPFPITDLMSASVSLDATESSYETLKYNLQYAEYPERQTTREKFHSWLSTFLGQTESWFKDYALSSEKLNNLKKIVELCEQNNIELYLFISPTHATHNEMLHLRNLWDDFEQWKRELVKIKPTIWDFSGYNSITQEPVSNKMINYIDNHHYTPQTGRLVLARIFNLNDVPVPSDFGVLLTPDNIEQTLLSIRQKGKLWRRNNAKDAQWVQEIQQEQLKTPVQP